MGGYETTGPKRSKRIFPKPLGSVADPAQAAFAEIPAASVGIQETTPGKSPRHGVHGEIPASQVGPNPLVPEGRNGGHFNGAFPGQHLDGPMPQSNGSRSGKQLQDLGGSRVRGQVPVLGLDPEEEIPDRAPDDPHGMSGIMNPPEGIEDIIRDGLGETGIVRHDGMASSQQAGVHDVLIDPAMGRRS
jgi:hypothetical protein